MENKARVYMLGAAAVVVSTVKMEDWQLAEKLAPEALTVMDEKGEPAFRVATCKGTGSMNRYGVVWGSYLTEEGYPTVTILIDDEVEDRKAAVMDVIGSALIDLENVEKAMPGILEDLRKKKAAIESYLDLM